jgi:hypothetical protein
MYYLLAAAALALLAIPARAATMTNCAAAWKSTAPADTAKTTYAAYSKICLARAYSVPTVAAPAAGATGQREDGTYPLPRTIRARAQATAALLRG